MSLNLPSPAAASLAGGAAGVPAAAAGCDYCGDPLDGRNRVERRIGDRDGRYCCLGCAFIAEQVALLQTGAGEAPRHAAPAARAGACTQLEVRGMVCAACAQLLEHRLRGAPGVASASVDFVARRALVAFDPELTDRAALAACIERAGYRARAESDPAQERKAERVELLRVLIAWLAMMQVMMMAVPGYLARPGEIAPDIEQMLRIGQLVLSAPVAIFCAAPFWRAAASQLRLGSIGMDVPIAVGLAAALAASMQATLAGRGAVYFDSATMLVALLLAVRWWQARALARTTAQIDAAVRQGRLRAHRLRGAGAQDYETIAAQELAAGDRVLVPAGEAVPADGRILEGDTSVSQAWLTGESAALDRGPGDALLAGSMNLGQAVVLQVTRAGDATSLAALERMIVEAAARRPAIIELANRVAARFAPGVLALAALTALAWLAIDPSKAAAAAIAVLVVTCPCALSLAAPLAMAVAQARMASRGVLLARPGAIETLARADTFIFDKTGTLTEGEPHLLGIRALHADAADHCLQIAAALDARSRHPFAQALLRAARERPAAVPAALRAAEVPGLGVEGTVNGTRYRLGRAQYALGIAREQAAAQLVLAGLRASEGRRAGSEVVLACEEGPLALLAFGETLRPDAAPLLCELGAGGHGLLLASGDSREAVERVTGELRALGVPHLQARPELSPAGKRRLLESLQREGRLVAMVGDGINDAPVIAQADASIALAGGSKLAQVRADVVIAGARLAAVGPAVALARRATRAVRQNLLWALLYNAATVPLASLGLVAPWVAAAGMAGSAAFVLLNSLRLRRAPGL